MQNSKQITGEEKTQFASRVLDESRVSLHVFLPVDLFNENIKGLQAFTSARKHEHVCILTSHERANIVRVLQVALTEGKSQRPFIAEIKEDCTIALRRRNAAQWRRNRYRGRHPSSPMLLIRSHHSSSLFPLR